MEGKRKKRKRKPPNKNAACIEGKTAENELQIKLYNNSQIKSRLKEQIGEILLFGNTTQKKFWSFFEVELTQFYDIKSLGEER